MVADIEKEKIEINKIKYTSTIRNIEDEIILYVSYTVIEYQLNNITNWYYITVYDTYRIISSSIFLTVLQRWVPWEDHLKYQEKIELAM